MSRFYLKEKQFFFIKRGGTHGNNSRKKVDNLKPAWLLLVLLWRTILPVDLSETARAFSEERKVRDVKNMTVCASGSNWSPISKQKASTLKRRKRKSKLKKQKGDE